MTPLIAYIVVYYTYGNNNLKILNLHLFYLFALLCFYLAFTSLCTTQYYLACKLRLGWHLVKKLKANIVIDILNNIMNITTYVECFR